MGYRIALLHYSCPPVVGGVEEIVRQQASIFIRYEHEVRVFTGSGGEFPSMECEVEINPILGSRSRRILSAQQLCHDGNPQKMEMLIKSLYTYLSEALKEFHVLIAHNVLTMPFNLPLTAALHRIGREGIIPIISWNHDSHYFYPDYPAHLDLFPWNMLKRAYAGIHYVVISESRKEMFARLYGTGKRLHIIPNGIDPVQFLHLDAGTVRLINEENLFKSEFLMVQPSRLHPRKNFEMSIRVTQALHDIGLKARLLITGAHDPHEPNCTEYLKMLKNLSTELGVEKDVLIIADYEFKNGEKLSADRIIIRDLYMIADVLFMPSLQEGFGIPLLESGMIRLPVICSNIPPFIEIGGENVCLFNLNDTPEKIAQQIVKFVGGLKTHHMYRKVMHKYVWDNLYHLKLLPLLDKIIGVHRESVY